MAHDAQRILVLNCGSSSLKFALLSPEGTQTWLSGLVECLGMDNASVTIKQGNEKTTFGLPNGGHEEAIALLLDHLEALGWQDSVIAVGHRVVNGGELFDRPVLVTPEVEAGIEALCSLAPLHNPSNLMGIRAAGKAFPGLPQVAVFDTAFHQTMPPSAYRYAIPPRFYTEYGVRRYGAHGTSHDYVARQAVELLNLDPEDHNILVAHLGNGASVAAVQNGRSVDTTMGMTPLEGLVMGTRSGDIDPGAIFHIARQTGMGIDELDDLLNKKSGLIGMTGLSSDYRTVRDAAAEGHEQAQLALGVTVHRLARLLGGLATNFPRLDALIFTGGIGENAPTLRAATAKRLALLGVAIDAERNDAAMGCTRVISPEGTNGPLVAVIPTNEELMIARSTAELIG